MPKIDFNLQWLIPVATAVWGVWTWAADREREHNKDRARISALYVLAEAQNQLVDLLSYLEGKEGYALFPGERKKCLILTPSRTRATRAP